MNKTFNIKVYLNDNNEKMIMYDDFVEMLSLIRFDKEELLKEIERLEKELELERDSVQLLTEDLVKKENIIKEVREYIEKELGNINTNENIIAKGICLKIKEIIGSDKE